jgi:diguanylate cyclase (GGDEF)-like protein
VSEIGRELAGETPVPGTADWQRHGIRDSVLVAAMASGTAAIAALLGVVRLLSEAAHQRESAQIDGLLALVFISSLLAIVFARRYARDFRAASVALRAAEDKAHALARHDPLTGLANPQHFTEQLAALVRQIRAERGRASVLMLELEGFGPINNLHGRSVGDQILVEFAARMVRAMDPGAVLARTGGNDFALVQPGMQSLEDPTRLARRLIVAAGEPFTVGGRAIRLGASIGIAVAPDDGVLAEDLIRRAALALDRAKAEGRSSVRFFEHDMDAFVERQSRIERELEAAIASSAIAAHYHPIVSLADNRIVAFEALARWKTPELGWVSPVSFLAIAEESGLISALGDQLLRRACADAKRWPTEIKLAFNISPHQLQDRALGLRILTILAESGLDPRRLELEITEGSLVGDVDLAARLISELRRAGVCIALDGFGTGHATIAQLLTLRFDKIKLARSIVHRLGKDPESDVVVKAMIGLAGALGLNITAEGIEKPDQLARLKAAGCAEGQGFLFGKAVPPADVAALLRRGPRATPTAPVHTKVG